MHALLVFIVTSRHDCDRNTAAVSNRLTHSQTPIVRNQQFDLFFRKAIALQKVSPIVDQRGLITCKRGELRERRADMSRTTHNQSRRRLQTFKQQ